jgi:hypothetical protein
MVLAGPKCSHFVLPSLGHVRRESQCKQFTARRQVCRSISTTDHSATTRSSSDNTPEHGHNSNNSSTAVVSLNANKRLAVLKASKSAIRPVKQLDKPLGTCSNQTRKLETVN